MDDAADRPASASAAEPAPVEAPPARRLTPEAERALAEAAERRAAAEREREARPKEIAGRGGLEPVRYGDWEVKGLTVDF